MGALEAGGEGGSVSEEKKEEGTDLSEYARHGAPRPEQSPDMPTRSTGKTILRVLGIALGIAAFIFLFVVGACFIALAHW